MLKKSLYRSYLPIPHKSQTFTTIPINDLSPDSLKKSAKIAKDNYCSCIGISKETIKHTTLLNQTVKALGFEGGFTGYQKKGWVELSNFLHKNGLDQRCDLITADDNDFNFHLSRRDIADRLFLGDSCPDHLFTGYNVNWREYDRLTHYANGDLEHYLKYFSIKEEDLFTDEFRKHFLRISNDNILFGAFHLLDDALVKPRKTKKFLIKLYTPETIKISGYNSDSKDLKNKSLFKTLFYHEIDSLDSGWVDIIPFNENLIFLKGNDGKYDFVFRDLREETPPDLPFSGGLKIDDVPNSFWQLSLFPFRYHYMEGQWDAKRRHDSELFFYRSYGFNTEYPGDVKILHDLYQWNNSTPKAPGNIQIPPNFQKVTTPDGIKLYVQKKPVTIGDFVNFMNDFDHGYYNRRFTNDECPWEPANLDNQEMPACVTYYDALAFTRYHEKKYGMPMRLLTVEEYIMIHPRSEKATCSEHNEADPGVHFQLPDGTAVEVDSFGRNVSQKKWSQVEAHYTKAYDWKTGMDGVLFFICHDFAEWLFDNDGYQSAAGLRTTTLTGVRNKSIRLGYHPMSSWGKYKHCKIGFRMCFEIEA